MTKTYHLAFLLTALLLAFFCNRGFANAEISELNSRGVASGHTAVSLNVANYDAPLLSVAGGLSSELDSLNYPDKDFALPLMQPLYYDANYNSYALTVLAQVNSPLQVLHLWHAPAGFYRTNTGPYIELEDFGDLKGVTALNGTRYLFTLVGGEWHCVSVHDSFGNYLLIDYRPDGLIARLRDSRSRAVVPAYSGRRLVSLTQTWKFRSMTRTQTTAVSDKL